MSALIIRDLDTDSEIKRIDTTGKSERQIEKLERGMSINLDHGSYYIDQEA